MKNQIRVALVSGGRESTAMGVKQGLSYYDKSKDGIMIFANTGDDPNGLAVVNDLRNRMERVNTNKKRQQDTNNFYLIQNHIDRKLCGEISKEYLGYLPKRSLCDMCFERTIADWLRFYKESPERCLAVMEFEESSKLFKKYGYGLAPKPIRKIIKLIDESKQMTWDQLLDHTALEEEGVFTELLKDAGIAIDTKPCACVEDFCLTV